MSPDWCIEQEDGVPVRMRWQPPVVHCHGCSVPLAEWEAHDGGIDDLGEQVWLCAGCCDDCTDGGHEVGS